MTHLPSSWDESVCGVTSFCSGFEELAMVFSKMAGYATQAPVVLTGGSVGELCAACFPANTCYYPSP